MLRFHLLPLYQRKHKLRSDPEEIRDLTVPPVALSWPLVSVHLTQLGCVSSRGECWNALTELRLRTQSLCFLRRKQRHNLGAEEIVWFYIILCSTWVGIWKTSVWWCFPPPEHRWKSLLCTHASLTHTLHPGGPGCPLAPVALHNKHTPRSLSKATQRSRELRSYWILHVWVFSFHGAGSPFPTFLSCLRLRLVKLKDYSE